MIPKEIVIDQIHIGNNQPIVLIAGPCVIESEGMVLQIAREIKEIVDRENIPYIFKSSYDKANRSSYQSFRGPGIEKGLKILDAVRTQMNVPVLSDVHTVEEAKLASEVLDILQIPSFLCRQTDLIIAAGETGKVVNLKKGQFLSPWEMKNVVNKVLATGNQNILLTERGTCFGYNNLVNDMRSLVIMRNIGFPTVFDATHSVQLPGGEGHATAGQPEFIPYLAKAATAVGIDALYFEVHPNPRSAFSDSACMLSMSQLPQLLKQVKTVDSIVKDSKANF